MFPEIEYMETKMKNARDKTTGKVSEAKIIQICIQSRLTPVLE